MDDFLVIVRGASTLAAQSENGYIFVFHGGEEWKMTVDADAWIAATDYGLMVHPDGRDDHVEAGN